MPDSGAAFGDDDTEVETRSMPETVYHYVYLVMTDIPSDNIGNVKRGVFLPLRDRVDSGLRFPLELDVTSQDGILERTLEQAIKEIVRKIGMRIEEEDIA